MLDIVQDGAPVARATLRLVGDGGDGEQPRSGRLAASSPLPLALSLTVLCFFVAAAYFPAAAATFLFPGLPAGPAWRVWGATPVASMVLGVFFARGSVSGRRASERAAAWLAAIVSALVGVAALSLAACAAVNPVWRVVLVVRGGLTPPVFRDRKSVV